MDSEQDFAYAHECADDEERDLAYACGTKDEDINCRVRAELLNVSRNWVRQKMTSSTFLRRSDCCPRPLCLRLLFAEAGKLEVRGRRHWEARDRDRRRRCCEARDKRGGGGDDSRVHNEWQPSWAVVHP